MVDTTVDTMIIILQKDQRVLIHPVIEIIIEINPISIGLIKNHQCWIRFGSTMKNSTMFLV